MVIDSSIINEFIDEAWPSKEVSLLPALREPQKRAKARLWVDFVNHKMAPPMYQLLLKQEKAEQRHYAAELTSSLKSFAEAMEPEGPFFMGESLGLVDIALVPFSLRFYVLKHYRGFEVPTAGDEWQRFDQWRRACENHPSVLATINYDPDKLCRLYKPYATNNARSQGAKALQENKPIP